MFSLSRRSVTQAASVAVAARVPVNLKLSVTPGVTMRSALPSRSASITGSELASGISKPWTSTTLATVAIGSRSSISNSTASVEPTCKLRLSSATSRPQWKCLLMTKPSWTLSLEWAVMVQSRNRPSSSKLALPCHTPEVNPGRSCAAVRATTNKDVNNNARKIMALPAKCRLGIKAQAGRCRSLRMQTGLMRGARQRDLGIAIAAPVDLLEGGGPGDLGPGAFFQCDDRLASHPSAAAMAGGWVG